MISACEWIFGDRPLEDVLWLLAGAGYDALEVTGEPARDAGLLAESLAAAGLRASGTTAVCNWPTSERDLAHPDGDVRRRAVTYYRGCVDLAAQLGAPVVGLIPTAVGRLDALSTYEAEWRHAVEGTREIALYAGEREVAVGVEAINRYETFLVNRVEQALELAADVDVRGVGVIPDAFHMAIEERDSAAAIEAAGSSILALHLADTNRLGLGHGQLALTPLIEAAGTIGFAGPFTMEFTAPGPDPFKADKGPEAMALLESYARESVTLLRGCLAGV